MTDNKGITGGGLKIIAIVAMFIDHFAAIFLTYCFNSKLPDNFAFLKQAGTTAEWFSQNPGILVLYFVITILRAVGRFGFPIFAFLLVEGFTHTRSVPKYARNLFIFALVSELPFNLGFRQKIFAPDYQNVFFTLFLALVTIWAIRDFAENRTWSEKLKVLFYPACFAAGVVATVLFKRCAYKKYLSYAYSDIKFWAVAAVVGVCVTAFMAFISMKWDADLKNRITFTIIPICIGTAAGVALATDYNGWGVLAIVTMYLFKKDPIKGFAISCLVLTIYNSSEVYAFLILPVVMKYNGKRGINLKYFFYAFYPVHILIIYLITYACGYARFAIR
ncbi:MAG: hypothetical protein HUJ70_08490 [Pseudobutyrivibrio sp.]|nr:hypothetical protein [Pseudobutyrivibrio sp.]